MKKLIIVLLLICSICYSFNNESILGTWKNNNNEIQVEITFLPDGSYLSKVSISFGRLISNSSFKGKYKITDKYLFFIIKNSIQKNLIIQLTPEKLILFNFKTNDTVVYVR